MLLLAVFVKPHDRVYDEKEDRWFTVLKVGGCDKNHVHLNDFCYDANQPLEVL